MTALHTRLLPSAPDPSHAIAEAARLLKQGEVVALPTETVYGLAANALDPAAVLKIFEAKERPFFDPLIVHLPGIDWLDRIANIPEADRLLVCSLARRYWPGPLTMVLPRQPQVPDVVTSGLPTVALRISAHPVFTAIAEATGAPLAAPSANRFGRISPTRAEHVMSELAGRIPLVVDGGATLHGVESTIIAVANGRIEILRNGPIPREEFHAFAPVTQAGEVSQPVAPGQLKSHYAPRTPLYLGLRTPTEGKRTGLLAWRAVPENAEAFSKVEILSASGDLREAAANLFAAMRRLDEAGLDEIVAEVVPEEGLGRAIMDRLRKASYRE